MICKFGDLLVPPLSSARQPTELWKVRSQKIWEDKFCPNPCIWEKRETEAQGAKVTCVGSELELLSPDSQAHGHFERSAFSKVFPNSILELTILGG